MSKRVIIEFIIGIILFGIGWIIGNQWQLTEFCLDLQVNIVDVISLFATVAVGIYIAWILEKEVQDRRIEKDMYLSKIEAIEAITEDIENIFQTNSTAGVDYKKMVNLEHRIKTKRDSIFKHLKENSHGKIKKELTNCDNWLKDKFKELRNSLTQTNADETKPKDIEIVDNNAKYSEGRTTEILTSLNNISNKLLEVKVLMHNMS